MGFISNPEEERFLNSDSAMTMMAQALVNAFGAYSKRVKKSDVSIQPSEQKTESQESKVETPAPKADSVFFAIQVCASKTQLAADDPKLKGVSCEFVQLGEWYKYYTAADADRAKVAAQLPALKQLFPDCWIIKVTR